MVSGGYQNYDNIVHRLKSILDSGVPVTDDQEEQQRYQQETANPEHEDVEENDVLLKFREHERERQRERKVRLMEQDRLSKYQRKLEDLLRWEKNRDKEREQEQDRLANFDRKKEQLIEEDLRYDSENEHIRAKRNPKEYHRQTEERKKLRQKERVDDEADR